MSQKGLTMAQPLVVIRRRRFHVPVDRFEIVNGPRHRRWMLLCSELTVAREVDVVFTLSTAASSSSFPQRMKLCNMRLQDDGTYFFTGICGGAMVAGYYNPHHWTGWFNEE